MDDLLFNGNNSDDICFIVIDFAIDKYYANFFKVC